MELFKTERVRRLIPVLTWALILVLGFFAFRGGIGFLSPTGLVVLQNTTLTGSFYINDNKLAVTADNADIKFSAPVSAIIKTRNGEINGTGSFSISKFSGTIAWNGKTIELDGTMASVHGSQLDITYTRKESTTITLVAGSIEVSKVNLSSFSSDLTGNLRLEDRWTVRTNETPISISGYEGSVIFQRVNNDTILYLSGNAEKIRVEQKNILKNIA
ncbi:MAG: hypothetical protein QXT19_02760 [Candidatus Woesearchaeota archaeon]